jgi:hypothetical protein
MADKIVTLQEKVQLFSDEWTSRWLQLDKNLRSSDVGKQCEAVVQMGNLMKEYPFPHTVNSILLKLADVFSDCSNFVRWSILHSVRRLRSRSLQRLLLNAEEVIKRVYTVLRSNDSTARALTLRLLAHLAAVLADRVDIHHRIRYSLFSHDDVEVDASIDAIERISRYSTSFGRTILPTLTALLRGVETSLRTKVKLIRVMQRMKHDLHTSTFVCRLAQGLLHAYPLTPLVVAVLTAVTHVARQQRVHIASVSALLFDYVRKEPRITVQKTALQCLELLLRTSAGHSFRMEDVIGAIEGGVAEVQESALRLLRVACRVCPDAVAAHVTEIERVCVPLLVTSASSRCVALCAHVLLECSHILSSRHSTTSVSPLLVPTPLTSLLSVFPAALFEHLTRHVANESDHNVATNTLICLLSPLIRLSHTLTNSVYCSHLMNFASSLLRLVLSMLPSLHDRRARILCRFLRVFLRPYAPVVHEARVHILACLQQLVSQTAPQSTTSDPLLFSLVILLLTCCRHRQGDCPDVQDSELLRTLTDIVTHTEHRWLLYRIAVRALALGWPAFAQHLFRHLLAPPSTSFTPTVHAWLQCVLSLAVAHSRLTVPTTASFQQLLAHLSDSLNHLQCAKAAIEFVALSAATSAKATGAQSDAPSECQRISFDFQLAYLETHMRIVHTVYDLVDLLSRELASTEFANSVSYITQRSTHIAAQFSLLSHRYHDMSETFSHLNFSSRARLDTLKLLCDLFSLSVFVLIVKSPREVQLVQNAGTFNTLQLLTGALPLTPHHSASHTFLESPALYGLCLDLLKRLFDFVHSYPQKDWVPYVEGAMLLRSFIHCVLSWPMEMPSDFFVHRPSMRLALTVQPSPQALGEVLLVQAPELLTLSIAGRLLFGASTTSSSHLFQNASAMVTVTTTPCSVALSSLQVPPLQLPVRIHKDAFSASCGVNLPDTGLYMVTVTARLLEHYDNHIISATKTFLVNYRQ